jgi:hypothetical protein
MKVAKEHPFGLVGRGVVYGFENVARLSKL